MINLFFKLSRWLKDFFKSYKCLECKQGNISSSSSSSSSSSFGLVMNSLYDKNNVDWKPIFHTQSLPPTFRHFIIIFSCHQHGYPGPSLSRHPSPPFITSGRSPGATPWAAVCRFEQAALLLHGHVKGSIARPYFSSSFLHVWFV